MQWPMYVAGTEGCDAYCYRHGVWLRGLRRASVAARWLGLRVRIPPGTWMYVS